MQSFTGVFCTYKTILFLANYVYTYRIEYRIFAGTMIFYWSALTDHFNFAQYLKCKAGAWASFHMPFSSFIAYSAGALLCPQCSVG